MRKLSKVMLSVAAVFAMTAAISVAAMAEDTITGSYDNATGLVTMDGVISSGKSQTILVLGGDEGEDIAYINQIDNNGTFSTFYLNAGLQSSEPVTYNIKIGGTDKSLQTGTLTIVQNTVTIVLGDVTQDNKANVNDINAIGKYIANRNKPGTGTGQTGVQVEVLAEASAE
jgi:hypothetical protein